MLKKLFGFDPAQTTVRTEIIAGVTTFLTMSYILAVNPSMFGQLEGMPAGAVFTSTALAAIVGCLAMAFCGKVRSGSRNGPQCLFRLQRMFGNGLFVAVCADSCAD